MYHEILTWNLFRVVFFLFSFTLYKTFPYLKIKYRIECFVNQTKLNLVCEVIILNKENYSYELENLFDSKQFQKVHYEI